MWMFMLLAFVSMPIAVIASIVLLLRLRRPREPGPQLTKPIFSTPLLIVLIVCGVVGFFFIWFVGSALAIQ